MIRRLIAAAAVAAAAATTLIGTPAQAAAFRCDTTNICLWQNPNFTEVRQQISGYAPYTDLNRDLHDNAESWGSATRSQRMCVVNWNNGRLVTLDTLTAGTRRPTVSAAVKNMADAVKQC